MEERTAREAWPGPSRSLPALRSITLDDLVQELLDRVAAANATQDRLHGLLDAVVGIATDLDLRRVLRRIVLAACQVADAKYGALGVLGADRGLSQFVTHGVTEEERARIGDTPHGRGVLGLLIERPEPIRLPVIGDHPQSYGFPPNHPVMHSFLGVPVRIQDRVFGNLYLAEKRGEAEFTSEDEAFVVALAAAAGVAIENARLYELSEERRRWLSVGNEIGNALLGETDRDTALRLVAARAREVSRSAVAALALLVDGMLRLDVVEGGPGELVETAHLDLAGTELEPVIAGGTSAVIDDVHLDERAEPLRRAGLVVGDELGPAVVVALRSADQARGVLVLVADRRERSAYTELDVEVAQSFATQAALAVARADALDDRELVAVLGDRDRIARDLHDVVIQQLFATGLNLQGTARLADRPEVRQSVENAVDVIDTVIRDIREAIFELHHPRTSDDLRTELRDLVDTATEQLGFVPGLRMTGALEGSIRGELRAHVLAVVRELLSNVARHAQPSKVDVHVVVSASRVRVTVTDDGVGMGEAQRRSGLANLAHRADDVGGSFEIWPAHPRGTSVEWRAPLVAPARTEPPSTER